MNKKSEEPKTPFVGSRRRKAYQNYQRQHQRLQQLQHQQQSLQQQQQPLQQQQPQQQQPQQVFATPPFYMKLGKNPNTPYGPQKWLWKTLVFQKNKCQYQTTFINSKENEITNLDQYIKLIKPESGTLIVNKHIRITKVTNVEKYPKDVTKRFTYTF